MSCCCCCCCRIHRCRLTGAGEMCSKLLVWPCLPKLIGGTVAQENVSHGHHTLITLMIQIRKLRYLLDLLYVLS